VIGVYANAGSIEGVRSAVEYGADGIGLLRTEFLFLGRSLPPDEEEQVAAYRAILDAASGPVTFRTLDAGGDKPLPYLDLGEEANPFLGLRGIRATLDRPDLLRTQIRAILRAAAGRPVRIMFPMIAELDELSRARQILDDAASGLGWPTRAEVGTMVEVPSAALLSTHLAEEVAFFSIGTNDLVQYTLAAERGNPRVAALADPLHPSVLRLIQMVCDAARARGRSVSVCGEAAADPDAIPLLIGMGVGELSVAGPAVPVVKEAVRAVRITDARGLAAEALRAASSQEVRNLVSARRAHSLRSPIPSAPKAADPGFR
jgi:phosphocarrier protein FPr